MWQRSHAHANYAAGKNALIKLKKEERVLGMEQRSNYAAAKDVRIKSDREECV